MSQVDFVTSRLQQSEGLLLAITTTTTSSTAPSNKSYGCTVLDMPESKEMT